MLQSAYEQITAYVKRAFYKKKHKQSDFANRDSANHSNHVHDQRKRDATNTCLLPIISQTEVNLKEERMINLNWNHY